MPRPRPARRFSIWTLVAPGALVIGVVVVAVVLSATFRSHGSARSGASAPTVAPTVSGATDTAAPPTTYVVRAGDTLTAIATRFGTDLATIIALNPKLDPQRLHPGDVLSLP